MTKIWLRLHQKNNHKEWTLKLWPLVNNSISILDHQLQRNTPHYCKMLIIGGIVCRVLKTILSPQFFSKPKTALKN